MIGDSPDDWLQKADIIIIIIIIITIIINLMKIILQSPTSSVIGKRPTNHTTAWSR